MKTTRLSVLVLVLALAVVHVSAVNVNPAVLREREMERQGAFAVPQSETAASMLQQMTAHQSSFVAEGDAVLHHTQQQQQHQQQHEQVHQAPLALDKDGVPLVFDQASSLPSPPQVPSSSLIEDNTLDIDNRPTFDQQQAAHAGSAMVEEAMSLMKRSVNRWAPHKQAPIPSAPRMPVLPPPPVAIF